MEIFVTGCSYKSDSTVEGNVLLLNLSIHRVEFAAVRNFCIYAVVTSIAEDRDRMVHILSSVFLFFNKIWTIRS